MALGELRKRTPGKMKPAAAWASAASPKPLSMGFSMLPFTATQQAWQYILDLVCNALNPTSGNTRT
jgi:hypothetical protein